MSPTYTQLSQRQREIWIELLQLEIRKDRHDVTPEELLEQEIALVHELGEIQAAMEVRMGRVLV